MSRGRSAFASPFRLHTAQVLQGFHLHSVKLDERSWLEVVDEHHRYAKNLRLYFKVLWLLLVIPAPPGVSLPQFLVLFSLSVNESMPDAAALPRGFIKIWLTSGYLRLNTTLHESTLTSPSICVRVFAKEAGVIVQMTERILLFCICMGFVIEWSVGCQFCSSLQNPALKRSLKLVWLFSEPCVNMTFRLMGCIIGIILLASVVFIYLSIFYPSIIYSLCSRHMGHHGPSLRVYTSCF